MSSPASVVDSTQIGFCSAVPIAQCTDIDNFFHTRKAQDYIKWFNTTLANKGSWSDVKLVDSPQNDIGFHSFWNRIDQIFGGTINLYVYAPGSTEMKPFLLAFNAGQRVRFEV